MGVDSETVRLALPHGRYNIYHITRIYIYHLSPQQIVRGGLLDDTAVYYSLLGRVQLSAVVLCGHEYLGSLEGNHLTTYDRTSLVQYCISHLVLDPI